MYKYIAITICLLISNITYSREFRTDYNLNVFYTQGFFYSTKNNIVSKSEKNITTKYKILGLNGFYKFNSNLDLSFQTINKQLGITYNFNEIEIDYLKLKYNYKEYSFTLGRIQIPFGFYNDVRNVSLVRPTVLLPQNIYPEDLRFTINSLNGAQINYNNNFKNLFYNINIGYGYNNPQKQGEVYFLTYDFPNLKFKNSNAAYFNFNVKSLREKFKLKYTVAKSILTTSVDYNPFIPIENGKVDLLSNILSLEYVHKKNIFSTEILYTNLNKRQFGIINPDDNIDYFAYYLQYNRIVTNKLNLVLRYEYSNITSDLFDNLQTINPLLDPSVFTWGETYNIGLNYKLNKHALIQYQYQYANNTSAIPNFESPIFQGSELRKYPYHLHGLTITLVF